MHAEADHVHHASRHQDERLRRSAAARRLAGFACCLLFAVRAEATILHHVSLEFRDDPDPFTGNVVDSNFARLEGATPAAITTDIFTAIGGAGFEATGSVGRFGSLGVRGRHSATGGMEVQVVIEDDNIVNPFSVPMRVVANFIIDGGDFWLVADGDGPLMPATLEWQLDLFSDSLGGIFGPHFQSYLDLETTAFSNGVLTTGGSDTGAFQTTPDGTRVEMPFSFQTLDLGVIPGGGVFDLKYIMSIRTAARVAEVVEFQFSDPLMLSREPVFSVSFLPVSAVPEPAPLALLAMALGLLTLWRWPRAVALPRRREHASRRHR